MNNLSRMLSVCAFDFSIVPVLPNNQVMQFAPAVPDRLTAGRWSRRYRAASAPTFSL